MTNKKLNHELDQLAAMFYQLGKAAAQVVSAPSHLINENGEVAVVVSSKKPASIVSKQQPQRILKAV